MIHLLPTLVEATKLVASSQPRAGPWGIGTSLLSAPPTKPFFPFPCSTLTHDPPQRTHDEMESRRSSSYSTSVRNSPPSYRSQRTQTDPGGSGLQLPRPLLTTSEGFRSHDDPLSPYNLPAERSHSQSH